MEIVLALHALMPWILAIPLQWLMRLRTRRQHGVPRPRIGHACSNARRGKKPEWVIRQLVLLKAHLPDAGCRTLAMTFNRVFAHREVSVSKSFVHASLRENAHAVWLARKAIRNATPRRVATNHCWGIDLTGRQDESDQVHSILGVLDHGSRRVLTLCGVPRKCGWTLLGHLCLAIAAFGKPRSVRTDNERCFTGRVFTTGLRLVNIRHQRIDLHCPWQNGRIERLFGTLKRYLRQWEFDGVRALDGSLAVFARWYNEIRPHQNLAGLAPREAWDAVDPFHAPAAPREVVYVQAWDGLLAGFHIRR